MAAKITSKGQITLPKWVRDALGVKPGGSVEFVLEKDHIHLLVAADSVADATAGSLKAYARREHSPAAERAMMERVRKEVAHAAAAEGLPRRHKRSS